MAEAAAGLSRDKSISVGRRYKAGTISAIAKNDSVLTSRDSLYQTFRRAIGNFKSGYNIPQPPLPPKQLDVTSLGNRIQLTWGAYSQSGPTRQGWRVYRTVGKYHAPDVLLATLGPTATSYDDTTAERGPGHFYHVVSYGAPVTDTTGGVSRTLILESSRYYAQTYDAAFLQRPPGDTLYGIVPANLSKIRIVPNPYIISSDEKALRFENEADKIAFFDIPAKCRIRIFTELGELVKEIVHDKPSGDEYWNSNTSSGQVVVSGVYIVVFEDMVTGGKSIQKLVIVR
jgi:hypothetical protein